MLELDGSEGEGGGQILRTALSLSLVTGQPFTLRNIRAGRREPGLRPQHLACIRGAEAISGASSRGAQLHSPELTFTPAPVRSGNYLLELGTAGSTPLLLQCLFFPLALAGGGTLTLRGGTHLPNSPAYPYLSGVWLPAIQAYGFRARLALTHAGFHPDGAGEIIAEISAPRAAPRRVVLPSRGALLDVDVTAFAGGVPFASAERQSKAAVIALRERGIYCHAENMPLSVTRSAGLATFIRAQFENTFAGFVAVGDRTRPAESVGKDAGEAFARFMESGGALDEHLGDQLLLPAALLASGRLGLCEPGTTRFTPASVTPHLTTQAKVIEAFLGVRIDVSPEGVEVSGASRARVLQPSA